MSFEKTATILMIVFVAVFISCDDLQDKVSEKTMQTEEINEELADVPLLGVSGFCLPEAISMDLLLSEFDAWEDVKEFIKDIDINAIYYNVTENNNTDDGWIGLYITDSANYYGATGQEPGEEMLTAFTDIIEIGWTYEDIEMSFVEGGKSRLEELILDFDQEFFMCLGWSGAEGSLNMQIDLTLDATVSANVI